MHHCWVYKGVMSPSEHVMSNTGRRRCIPVAGNVEDGEVQTIGDQKLEASQASV